MAEYITKDQYRQIEDASLYDVTKFHNLLKNILALKPNHIRRISIMMNVEILLAIVIAQLLNGCWKRHM